MLFRFLPVAFTVLAFQFSLFAQSTISIPQSSSATIDGKISAGEWDNCDSIEISFSGRKVKVLFKHDGANLYLAYRGSLQSANVRFPEVLLDINNDKSPGWMVDDWWFHVSATDCDYQGQYGNYDSCAAVRPNWTAVPNFTMGGKITDTVEVKIPFHTVGLDLNVSDSIGLAFNVTNTLNQWNYWPTSADKDVPLTWGTAFFQRLNFSTAENSVPATVSIYPNPNNGNFTLIASELLSIDAIRIYDLTGRLIHDSYINEVNENGQFQIESHLPSGTYYIAVQSGNQNYLSKLIMY